MYYNALSGGAGVSCVLQPGLRRGLGSGITGFGPVCVCSTPVIKYMPPRREASLEKIMFSVFHVGFLRG